MSVNSVPTSIPMEWSEAKPRWPKGSIRSSLRRKGSAPPSYRLRVQQLDYAKMARQAIGPVTLLLLLALLGYEFSKSKRWRNWRVVWSFMKRSSMRRFV